MTAFVLGESDASVFVTPATLLLRLKFHSFIHSLSNSDVNKPTSAHTSYKQNEPSIVFMVL